MGKIIIFCGISNSGKSTMASTIVQHNPEKYAIVNRDSLRLAFYGYNDDTVCEYYERGDFNYLESQISEVQDNLIRFWLERDKYVLVDNTNLRLKYIKDYEKFGVETEVQFFDVTLKEALTRNMSRQRKVGKEIIEKQYEQYLNLRNILQESDK